MRGGAAHYVRYAWQCHCVIIRPRSSRYVADNGNHAIRTVAFDGTVATLAGTGSSGFVNGAGDQASFYYPSGVAFDPDSDTV